MSDSGGEQRTIDELVESFVGRLRAGDQPSIEDYQQRNPHLSQEIGQLFPSLEMREQGRPGDEDALPTLIDAEDVPADELGDYRIIREIGRGGMGIVYEADHVTMRRRVALKVLPKSVARRSANVERFQQEARATGQLHHTNIVPVFEFGEENGFHYYAMQFIRGQNLDLIIDELRAIREQSQHAISAEAQSRATTDALLPTDAPQALSQTVAIRMLVGRADSSARVQSQELANALDHIPRKTSDDPAREDFTTESVFDVSDWSFSGRSRGVYFHRVAALGLQVAAALAYSHQNDLLHRDIKPANLILDTDGIVWITDFGLAKGLQDDPTQAGDIVGTLRYMAPECFAGQTDSRSDIYSLGLTLYEMCTLQIAFQHTDQAELVEHISQRPPARPRSLEPSIPKDLETIILKASDRDPDRRYQTARQLSEDLKAFLADRPIQARRITLPERFWRSCRRNPWAATMSVVSLVLLVTVAIGATVSAFRFNRQSQELQVQNQRATSHLELTEETIEKMLNRVGHDLAGVPQMEGIRHGLFAEALALQKQVLALEPDNPQVAMRTIAAHRRMALIQHQMGQQQAAKDTLRRTLELIQAISGNGYDKLLEFGRAQTLLASWLRAEGNMTAAVEQAQLAIVALDHIQKAAVTSESRVAVANAYRQLGAVQEQTGQIEQSEVSLQTALATLEGGSELQTHGDHLVALAETLNSLAILYRASSRFDEAEQHYRRVIELCERHRETEANRLDLMDQMGISALNLGNLLMVQRRHDDAAEVYEQAAATFRQLQRDFPLTVRFQRRAAQAQLSLGLIYSALEQPEEAEQAYRQAIRKSEMIDATYGEVPGSLDTQAVCFNNLGNLWKSQQRYDQAIGAFENSIALRERRAELAQADPTNIKSLALSKANLADTLAAQEQFDRALEIFLAAHEDISPLVLQNPSNVSYLRVADFICGKLSDLLADMGRYDEVERWVERLAELKPTDAQHQLKAARQLERAAALIRDDKALDGAVRQSLIDAFADQATALIAKALAAGWQPETPLSEGERFHWLLEHERFQQLLE